MGLSGMKKLCNVPMCHRPSRTHGMCNAHYYRFRRCGSPIGKTLFRDSIPKKCSYEGCEKPHATKGYCNTHYERLRKNGTLAARQKRSAGTGTIKAGYVVFVRHLEGRKIRIRRCRHVMEKILGRALRPDETVHHKNGDKLDDSPANLELWSTRHPKGQRVQDLIDYARWILETYSADDAQICKQFVTKMRGLSPGAHVTITVAD